MAGDRRAGQHHRASRGPAELTGQAAVGEPVRCRVPTRPPAEMSRCAPSAEGDGGRGRGGPGMRRKTQAGLAELKKAVTAQLEVLGAATPEFCVTGGASRRRLREPGTWKRGQAPNPARRELPGRGGDWLAATRPLSIEFPVFLLFSSMLLRDALRPAPCPRPWPPLLPLQSGLLLLPLHLSSVYIIFEEPRSPWGHLPRPLQRRGTPLPRVPVSPVVGSSLEQVQ